MNLETTALISLAEVGTTIPTGERLITPQSLMAVGVLFSPMVSGWSGGRAGGRVGGRR